MGKKIEKGACILQSERWKRAEKKWKMRWKRMERGMTDSRKKIKDRGLFWWTTGDWHIHKYLQRCLCETNSTNTAWGERGGGGGGGVVVWVSQGGLLVIRMRLCKACGQRRVGSHASTPLGANIKRVNNTQESLCAPALVSSIHFCFQYCVQVCVVKNKSALDKTIYWVNWQK